jgi:hypothetical protein
MAISLASAEKDNQVSRLGLSNGISPKRKANSGTICSRPMRCGRYSSLKGPFTNEKGPPEDGPFSWTIF